MRAKPWNMKYTDLCIYIDKTIYERDQDNNPTALRKLTNDEIDNVYTYLYNVIYALSVKKRLFTQKADYDAFCLEAAGDIFMRLEKPDQDFTYQSKHNKPIKSVLNYIKGALGFMSITWRNTNYASILNPEYDSQEKVDGVKSYAYSQASTQYEEQKTKAYQDVIENLPSYLEQALKVSIFNKNKLKKHQILLSQYLSLSNCLTLENKKSSFSQEKRNLKILSQIREKEKFIVVLSDDPLITPDLIELQLKRGLFLMEDEVNSINSDLSPSDEELQNILSTSLATYDTDQSGEF